MHERTEPAVPAELGGKEPEYVAGMKRLPPDADNPVARWVPVEAPPSADEQELAPWPPGRLEQAQKEHAARLREAMVARGYVFLRARGDGEPVKVGYEDALSFSRPLEDWQLRVLGEAYELNERMKKLAAFVQGPSGSSLPAHDRRQMNRQWWAMDAYHQVLRERIAGFGTQG